MNNMLLAFALSVCALGASGLSEGMNLPGYTMTAKAKTTPSTGPTFPGKKVFGYDENGCDQNGCDEQPVNWEPITYLS